MIKQTRPAAGVLHVGIYSLDGDKLKICFAIAGDSDGKAERPSKYESPDNESQNEVFFLERKKDAKNEKDK